MEFEIKQPEIFEAVKSAVKEGLEKVRDLKERNVYISTYFEFPKMYYFESGLPSFSLGLFDGPTDYSSAFQKEIKTDSIKSFQQLPELIPKYPALKRYFAFQEGEDISSRKFEFQRAIAKIIDHYIHINERTDFDEEAFLPIYIEWERCAFLDELPFNILVPLIYITFDFEELELGEGVAIKQIPKPVQLARIERKSGALTKYESVTGAATHALVLTDWIIPNTNWIQRYVNLSNAELFSNTIEKVDLFLAAFRVITGVETGYSQLVSVPYFWGDRWEAHLPDVGVVSVKAYPEYFDNGGWLKKPPVINRIDCEQAFKVYKSLESNKSNKLFLATRRLNTAFLRNNEDDAILDITIGLESLLANDSRSEITYRLSFRLAGLSVIEKFEDKNPVDVFDLCKKLYDYRSAVAHGSHEINKKRVITLQSDTEPAPAILRGISILRYAIRIISSNPDLLDAKKLDNLLLEQFSNKENNQ